MHDFTINAGIQLLPIHTKEHPYEWVDRVIAIIQQSGLAVEVGAFNTSVEGTYGQVRQLVDEINEFLLKQECPEWLLNVQYQIRSIAGITAIEKTEKFREKL